MFARLVLAVLDAERRFRSEGGRRADAGVAGGGADRRAEQLASAQSARRTRSARTATRDRWLPCAPRRPHHLRDPN